MLRLAGGRRQDVVARCRCCGALSRYAPRSTRWTHVDQWQLTQTARTTRDTASSEGATIEDSGGNDEFIRPCRCFCRSTPTRSGSSVTSVTVHVIVLLSASLKRRESDSSQNSELKDGAMMRCNSRC